MDGRILQIEGFQKLAESLPAIRPVLLWPFLTFRPFDGHGSGLDKGIRGSACPRAGERAMLGNRLLIVAGGCLLAASAAKADGVGYIDCREHPEQTPVFAKARQTHEVVANLPCGERFTILLNGFIFSRIQTGDGQVGYVFSNVISVDHSGAIVQRTAPAPVTAPNPATSAAPVV